MHTGRIRSQQEVVSDELDEKILSLNVVSSHYLPKQHDERTFYHFEVAWDSSLHNSLLLNRCTPHGSSIYLTIASSLNMENCFQPAVISKDLCLVLFPRSADSSSRLRSSLRNFFHSTNTSSRSANQDDHSDCISAIYEIKLNRASALNSTSPDSLPVSPGVERRQRKVIDTSTIYVRGEEMLHGWKPRRDSLIVEHQQDLGKLYKIESVSGEMI